VIKVNATATQPTDRYPSRVGESGGMRERTDPVLWGRGNSPAVGPLSGQQLARYDADGFLVMDGLIDADTVDACLDDISAKEAGEPPSPDLAITEPDGGLLRSLFAVHKGASALGALVVFVWLPARADLPVVGPLMELPATAHLFAVAGALYDCLVVATPHERWGNQVTAVVSTRNGAKLSLDEIQKETRKLIADYKVPRQLHLADEIVRQPNGKPDYKWAKQFAMDGKGLVA